MPIFLEQLKDESEKRAMTRDLALSWRMGRFLSEVETDSKIINTSVAVMVCTIAFTSVYTSS